MKKYLLVFYLLILCCMSLKAESTRQTVMIINGIKGISGFASTDSILFTEMRFSMMNVPIDSLDFNTIIKTVEKQKAVVSADVYFALNYVVFSGLFNRFGKRDNSKAIDFGFQLFN